MNKATSDIEKINGVRDSPSLVWGRPAKSVVERPRGFNSHIPRQAPFAIKDDYCHQGKLWNFK